MPQIKLPDAWDVAFEMLKEYCSLDSTAELESHFENDRSAVIYAIKKKSQYARDLFSRGFGGKDLISSFEEDEIEGLTLEAAEIASNFLRKYLAKATREFQSTRGQGGLRSRPRR